MKERNYYLDNLKVILIFLVVIGHMVAPFESKLYIGKFLLILIYTFHMPLFIFVSGYLSKKNNLLLLVKKLLIPYIIFQAIYFFFYKYYMLESNYKFTLFTPAWTLWYLMALFIWRLLVPYMKSLKPNVILIVSIIAGILAGYDATIGYFLSFSRLIVFSPFFILGYYFNIEYFISNLCKNKYKFEAMFLLLIIFILIYIYTKSININLFYGSMSFEKCHINKWYAGTYRFLAYSLTFIISFLILIVIPQKKTLFSWIGKKTLNIYLLHGFFYRIILKNNIYSTLDSIYGLIFIICFSCILTLLLASRYTDFIINPIFNIPIDRFFTKVDKLSTQHSIDKIENHFPNNESTFQ